MTVLIRMSTRNLSFARGSVSRQDLTTPSAGATSYDYNADISRTNRTTLYIRTSANMQSGTRC
jgi:hypothetical protein